MIDIYDADGGSKSIHRGDHSDGLLRDRFQGAVMGLWMVPMALYSNNSQYGDDRNFNADSGIRSFGSDLLVEADNEAAASAAITGHLTEIDAFLHSPQRFKSSKAGSDSVLSSLPVLLRYHSDSVRRCHAVFEFTSSKEPEPDVQRLGQKLIFGDILSIVLGSSRLSHKPSFGIGSNLTEAFPTAATLEARASDCGLSSLQHRCYQDLWQSLRNRVMHGLAVAGDAVVDGIAIALTQPNNYSAAVQQAQRTRASSYVSNLLSAVSNKVDVSEVDASEVDSVLVTSVIAGALSGRKSLPVLWQLRPDIEQSDSRQPDSRQPDSQQPGTNPDYVKQNYRGQSMRRRQVVSMANLLFDQWAGIARKSHTIIAK